MEALLFRPVNLNFKSCFFFQTSSDGNVTTSIISLTPGAEDSGLTLLCKASNPHLPSATLEDSWHLQVECNNLLIKYLFVIDNCMDIYLLIIRRNSKLEK